jgi:hypothetical protein
MTDQMAVTHDPLTADRQEARKRVARRLQWACARFPMSVASDDSKALIVAELILRDIEGRQD